MKFFFKILLLFTIVISFLNAEDEITSKELYLEYSTFPNRVFTGQKFEVKLKALILKDSNSYDDITTTLTQEENIELLTKDVVWTQNKTNEYTTTLIYKVFNTDFILPKITLALSKDEEIIDYITIDSPEVEYEKIAVNQKLFSNIIAKELEVFTVKTKQYTNNILHTTINIKATNGNLEDFKLNTYGEEQGINSLDDVLSEQNLYYYVMIPSHTKEIKFNYYNTELNDFVMLQLPIIMDEELVSTQTELNPYNSSILIYKQILSAVLLLVFIVIYFFNRKNIYLVIISIFIVLLAYLFMPNEKILLKKDIKVYILPTNNSTVFKVLDSKEVVKKVNEKENFIKVLFDNDSIGWIKKNDI